MRGICFLLVAALCCLSVGAYGAWHSVLQVAISGGGGSPTTCPLLAGVQTGIILCLDASAGVTLSGSNVTTWTDQQNSYAFTPGNCSATNPPVFSATSYGGLPGITFANASGECVATGSTTVAVNSTSSWFFCAATQGAAVGSVGRLISFLYSADGNDFGGTNSVAAILANNAGQNWYFQQTTSGPPYTITGATPSRFGVTFDNTNGTTFLNNVQQAQQAATFTLGGAAGGKAYIGNFGGGGDFWDGVVRRCVAGTGTLSSGNRTNIDTFLTN